MLCQVWPSATPGDAQRAAHALHARLTAPCVIRGRTLRLGASLGVDLTRIDADLSLPAAISRADLAASEAKRLGRGRVVVYQPQLYDQQQRKLALGVALNTAHRDDSLRLNFQPVVRASDGQPAAFEALLRWQPSGFGPVSPDEFIPLAEESDHILRLGDWALRQACLTIYVRHLQDAPTVAAALAEQLGEGAPALATAVWLQADICRDDLLVEIEGVVNGAAPG